MIKRGYKPNIVRCFVEGLQGMFAKLPHRAFSFEYRFTDEAIVEDWKSVGRDIERVAGKLNEERKTN